MTLLRSDVPECRKWDLTPLFASSEEFEKAFAELDSAIPAMSDYVGKLTEETAIECLRAESELGRKLERLYVYGHLLRDEDTSDPQRQALMARLSMLLTKYFSAVSFINPELSKLPVSTLKRMAESEVYADYDVYLKSIIRNKKHILGAKEEKLLSEISAFSDDFSSIFSMYDNADIKFGKINVDGEDVALSHGMYSVLLQNPDQKVRKEAFETYYKSYRDCLNTISATYAGNVKKDSTLARIRGYKSALAEALYADDISDKVYSNLIKAVRKGTPAVHKYVKYRKKALKLKELHMYDMYLPITEDYKLELDYDDAYKLVIEALAPLGEDYKKLLESAYSERWIDVEETKNKRSGAYSSGMYDAHPYVLLNYQKTPHDVFTIAHELGHAMHSYLSNTHQVYQKADYRIFVAEIASTVNEVLLLKHLIKSAEGEAKKYLLSYYLDMFRTTVFRQTMFAEFEMFSHAEFEEGRPLTAEIMSNKYYELNKQYYGDGVIHDQDIAIEWARIPHFYTSFYVYKYATGLITAVNIANRLLTEEGYLDKYIKFLSTGGSLYPLPTIEIADVDLRTTKPFDFAMKEFASTLAELKKL